MAIYLTGTLVNDQVSYSTGDSSGVLYDLGLTSLDSYNVVYTTGDQTISGLKDFATRPTVNGTGVVLEGEVQNNTIISGIVYSAQVNVKNGEEGTIYKGQPVYIKDAHGTNIIVGLASNTGESTSSKTLGLIVQDALAQNEFGTVITEGFLGGFDASIANAGDPIWLGPTGSLIYGLTNKPYAPDHLVYLGVVTRAQNNGELFVKVQNGYELDELHDVAVKESASGQFLFKNNNLWSGKQINISDVSELQASLDSKITGVSQFNYISGDLTGGLLTPTISKIQGNSINAQSPVAGQTLQWNGSSWVAGSIPNGGNGGGGVVYYFNFANTSGIAPTGGLPTSPVPVSLFGKNYSVGSGQVQSSDLSPKSNWHLICGFVTPSGDPGITDIPAGLWDFNIWASADSTTALQTAFKLVVNKYNSSNSTYTQIAESDIVYIYDPTVAAQYIANVTVPQTTILSSERIYVEVYGKKETSASRTITLYFDSLRPSHCHTTIPSVAGNGVVKVVNGVLQSPASKIINDDISTNAEISIGKLSMPTNRLLGRTTAGIGPVETISAGSGLYLSSGNLNLTGVVSSNITNLSGANPIFNIVQITQSGYNAAIKDNNTLYIITE
jgi:hypothetical protein